MSHAVRAGAEPMRSAGASAVAEPAPAAERAYQGLATRAIAFTLDAALINLVAIVVAGAISLMLSVLHLPHGLDDVLIASGAAVYVLWSVAYFVTFWSATGQTPGDRVMHIAVRRADGDAPIGPARALLRLVALTLAVIPLGAGLMTILVDDRRRGVHDMVAGTVVVAGPDAATGGA
jgi:uncharacterized RDD family membrane protein YckC